jgi:hypothetical protein
MLEDPADLPEVGNKGDDTHLPSYVNEVPPGGERIPCIARDPLGNFRMDSLALRSPEGSDNGEGRRDAGALLPCGRGRA